MCGYVIFFLNSLILVRIMQRFYVYWILWKIDVDIIEEKKINWFGLLLCIMFLGDYKVREMLYLYFNLRKKEKQIREQIG